MDYATMHGTPEKKPAAAAAQPAGKGAAQQQHHRQMRDQRMADCARGETPRSPGPMSSRDMRQMHEKMEGE